MYGYCKDNPGSSFIEQGDYQVIHTEDNQVIKVINRSEFMVQPGAVLEMSIVMRQKATFQDKMEKCPRCGHLNLDSTPINGWIEWQVGLDSFYSYSELALLIVAVNVRDSSKLHSMRVIKRMVKRVVGGMVTEKVLKIVLKKRMRILKRLFHLSCMSLHPPFVR